MRTRGLFVGTLLVLVAAAGCGDMWGDLFGSKRSAVDPGGGGSCTKDDAVLTQIILSPPACSASAVCPCGSYCSSTINGVCVVDCRSDDECATGKTCSQFGQCVGAGSSDGGVPANPSCPRDVGLMMSQACQAGMPCDPNVKRHCSFDDECPYGTHCDNATRLCTYSCADDSGCASDGGSSQVCSCLGVCVDPSLPPTKPAAAQPTLHVTPVHYTLPSVGDPAPATPDWGASSTRDVTVSMTSDVLVGSGATPDVFVNAGANVQVQCPGQTTFANSCQFNLGALAAVTNTSTYKTADAIVTMQPVPTAATDPPATRWDVRIGANGAASSPQTASVAYATAPSAVTGPPAGTWLSGDVPVAFTGTGTFEFDSPTGEHISVPVLGRGDATWKLVLYDAAKIISESGKFALSDPRGGITIDPDGANDWVLFPGTGHTNALTGLLQSYLSPPTTRLHTLVDGTVDGVDATFNLHFRTNDKDTDDFSETDPIAIHVLLHSTSNPGMFCANDGDCPTGLVCDLNFCSIDRAPTAQVGSSGSVFALSSFGDRSAPGVIDESTWRVQGDPWHALCNSYNAPLAGLLSISGEMECDTGTPLDVPLLSQADLDEQTGATPKSAADLLSACLSELSAFDSLSGLEAFPSYDMPDQLPPEFTANRDCVSLGRWSAIAEPQSAFPELAHRAWQQWLELHSFVGREGLQENDIASVLGQAALMASNSPTPPAPTLGQLQTEMDVGWQWLLARIWTFKYPNMPYPDYRYHTSKSSCVGPNDPSTGMPCPNWLQCQGDQECGTGRVCDTTGPFAGPAGSNLGTCVPKSLDQAPNYEQPVGLPAHLLQTMTAHLQVTSKLTQAAAVDAFSMGSASSARARAVAQAGRTLRLALLVESIASTMKNGLDTYCLSCNSPAVATRWDSAIKEFKVARDELFSKTVAFMSGGNPLGIRDDDIPLFFGDPTGTNSQYFASSDYLIDGWAAPAVTAAQSSLATARDAWSAREHDVVQNLQSAATRAQYLDQIKQSFGEKIIDNCGPIKNANGDLTIDSVDVLDFLNGSSLDLSTCFIDPSCVGTDNIMNAGVRSNLIASQFTNTIAQSELCKLEYVNQVLASCGQNDSQINKTFPELASVAGSSICRPPIPQLQGKDLFTQMEPGMTDIQCFLGNAGPGRYEYPPDCGGLCPISDETPESATFATTWPDANAAAHLPCGAHQRCTTFCKKRLCSEYTLQSDKNACTTCAGNNDTTSSQCAPYQCDDFRRQGCSDDACTYVAGSGSLSLHHPDDAFESHPWLDLADLAPCGDGRKCISTTKPRHNLLDRTCKIPVDYLFGAIPDSWGGYKSVADTYPDLWMAATMHCSSGAAIAGTTQTFPFVDSPLPMPTMAASCFSGKMGITQNQIQGAQLGLEKTREEIAKKSGDMNELFNNCQKEAADLAKAQAAHRGLMGSISTGLSIASAVASFAFPPAGDAPGIIAIVGAIANPSKTPNASTTIERGGASAVATLSGIGAALNSHYNSAAADADTSFSQNATLSSCWFQYHSMLRDAGQNMTDIKLALNAIDTQRATMQTMVAANNQAKADGEAKVLAEQSRTYGSYSHDYWFDDKVDRFRNELEWARRLTYLAMEAVEYEFQQSLPYRHDILAATSPDQLETVIRGLKQEQGSRTVNRRRPDESSIVLSLRDDVLHIPDRSAVTTSGERAWTPAQRMQGRLDTSAYSYFDKSGNYLGQAVPFSLGPDGILATRCGERLWRVTATVQGDGLSDVAPNAPLLLLKKNTFESQWCRVNGAEPTGMQSGRIYPSESLFAPGTAVQVSDPNDTTAALMTPWFNIPRTDFYKDSYRDGASEELAGRGLYGDYVLLFPTQLLDGDFPIERVEDVLLRFDYLSVDNLAQ
jgi:hypothetical protein